MRSALLLSAAVLFGAASPAWPQTPAAPAAGSIRVLDDVEYDYGDYTLRYQRIAPPRFLPAAPAIVPAAPPTPEQLAALERTARKPRQFVALAATVFDGRVTFLRWSDAATEYCAVSNLDFHHFAGLITLETADTVFTLHLALESESLAGLSSAETAARLGEWGVDRLPEATRFPAGVAACLVLERRPARIPGATTLAAIGALHAHYSAHRASLEQRWHEREAARLAAERQLREHPPAPLSLLLRFWPVRNSAYLRESAPPIPTP